MNDEKGYAHFWLKFLKEKEECLCVYYHIEQHMDPDYFAHKKGSYWVTFDDAPKAFHQSEKLIRQDMRHAEDIKIIPIEESPFNQFQTWKRR